MDYSFHSMDPALRDLWIEALESGEYKQGRGFLKIKLAGKDTAEHCCLGVLAEVALKNGYPIADDLGFEYGIEHQSFPNDVGNFNACMVVRSPNSHRMNNSLLPPGALGLDAPTQLKLCYLNDADRFDFNEIANFIRMHST